MATRKVVVDTSSSKGQLFKVWESGGVFHVYKVNVGFLWDGETSIGNASSLADSIELIKASVEGTVYDVKISDW